MLIATSFVYAGTRHEDLPSILRHAVSCAVTMLLIMLGFGVILELLAYFQ